MESYSTWLRRLWSSTWDAGRFAVERPLHTPAFTLAACSVQLDLAAQAVLRLRAAVAQDAEVMELLPLEGRSCSFLERAVDGAEGALSPTREPAGFVRGLVHAALQTGDGSYGLGLGEAAVDALIDEHCADLMAAATDLQDPEVALKELQGDVAELTEAMQLLHSLDIKASGVERSVELSSQVRQLTRDIRELVGRVRELVPPPQGPARPAFAAEEAKAGDEQLEAASTAAASSVAAASSTAAASTAAASCSTVAASTEEEPESPPAFEQQEEEEEEEEGSLLEDGGPASAGETDDATRLQRTKSQVVKRIKVDEVAQALETHREPVQQLRKALSQLDGQAARASSATTQAPPWRYEQVASDLKQAQKLQQSFRDFGEDLMEGMLKLDQLSGLAEEDRQVRKDTLKGIQGLLDEIDAAKPRVARMQTRLSEELKSLEPSTAREHSPAREPPAAAASPNELPPASPPAPEEQQEPRPAAATAAPQPAPQPRPQQAQSVAAPLASPQVDWTRLRLPLKFSSDERPRAYLLSASAAGLDPESIRLLRKDGGVLSIQGTRLPSAQAQRAMMRTLAEHIQRMPRQQRQRLTQREADDMLLQLGHGRFGRFVQDFELPHDVDWEGIEPSYEDGVLRVLLPRRPVRSSRRPGGRVDGMPSDLFW